VSLPGGEGSSPLGETVVLVSCGGVASLPPRLHATDKARLRAMAHRVTRLNQVACFILTPRIIAAK